MSMFSYVPELVPLIPLSHLVHDTIFSASLRGGFRGGGCRGPEVPYCPRTLLEVKGREEERGEKKKKRERKGGDGERRRRRREPPKFQTCHRRWYLYIFTRKLIAKNLLHVYYHIRFSKKIHREKNTQKGSWCSGGCIWESKGKYLYLSLGSDQPVAVVNRPRVKITLTIYCRLWPQDYGWRWLPVTRNWLWCPPALSCRLIFNPDHIGC